MRFYLVNKTPAVVTLQGGAIKLHPAGHAVVDIHQRGSADVLSFERSQRIAVYTEAEFLQRLARTIETQSEVLKEQVVQNRQEVADAAKVLAKREATLTKSFSDTLVSTPAGPVVHGKPLLEKPEAEKPEAEKPAAEKPEAEKPEAEKPEAEKPAAEKPEAEKPEEAKPEEAKPEASDFKTYAAFVALSHRERQVYLQEIGLASEVNLSSSKEMLPFYKDLVGEA